MNKGTILGAYNCFENKQTLFLYRCYTRVQGFMLRKYVWLDLVEEIPEIGIELKENIRIKYVRDIYLKVNQEKKIFMRRMRE